MLPVKLMTSGIEYAGVRSKLTTVQKIETIFVRSQDRERAEAEEEGGDAAARHAAPRAGK